MYRMLGSKSMLFLVNFTSFEIEMLFAVVTVTCLDLHVWILMFEEIASDNRMTAPFIQLKL